METEKLEKVIENLVWLERYVRLEVLNRIENSEVVDSNTFHEIIDKYYEMKTLFPFIDDELAEDIGDLYMLVQNHINKIMDLLREFLREKEKENFNESVWVNTLNNKWREYTNEISIRIYDIIDNIKPILSNKHSYSSNQQKAFIVHGHDEALKNEVARFIERLGIEAIILHEQASLGKTIIEKIEYYSNVSFGIVLYSPCDIGGQSEKDLQPRARQNVVFEHGYLIGKIGRENIVALVKDNVEKPSDISGIDYIDYNSNNWKLSLAIEMKAVGLDIDLNKIL